MTALRETIPDALRPEVDAAVAWFNRRESLPFEVTGILDAEASLAQSDPRTLRLVLCGGDRCEQRSFRVGSGPGGYEVAFLDDGIDAAGEQPRPAELDPPPGALRGWLERTLSRERFTVMVFYRGFW